MSMVTHLGKMAAPVACMVCATLFIIAAAQPSSASFPSQVDVPASRVSSGFYFPEQLEMFDGLATSSASILQAISAHNSSTANASLANYSKYVNALFTWQGERTQEYSIPGNPTVLSAMSASQTLYGDLVAKSKRFEQLSAGVSATNATSQNFNQSALNALEMKRLNGEIKALRDQINATNDVIYSPAVEEAGLDMTDYYAPAQESFGRYINALDDRVATVTNATFHDTVTTANFSQKTGQYADEVQLHGAVRDGETGVANGTVMLLTGTDRPVGTTRTNATGNYNYTFLVDNIPPGANPLRAHYEPTDQPYKASNSSVTTFTVKNVSATNTLNAQASSPLGNSLTFNGIVATKQEPVKNGTVTLYRDGEVIAQAATDANGTYQLSYHVSNVEYLGSLLRPHGYTFYSVFNPGPHPLGEAQSDPITEPASGAYLAAALTSRTGGVAVFTALLVATIAVYVHRKRTAARMAMTPDVTTTDAGVLPQSAVEEAVRVDRETGAPVRAAHQNTEAIIGRTRGLSEAGEANTAIITVYNGAVNLISSADIAIGKASLTHWDRYVLVERRTPAMRDALHDLTLRYEWARYSGRRMTERDVEAAIRDLTAIDAIVQGAEGEA
ncbi:MAG: Ig-like domain-containing protein [Halobacteriota archaeon]